MCVLVYVCLHECMCTTSLQVPEAISGLDLLEMESPVGKNYPVWVLGAEPQFLEEQQMVFTS